MLRMTGLVVRATEDKNLRQDFRITPYINYACVHCLKKTKDRTILSSAIVLEIFNFFSKSFLKRAKFAAF